MGVGAGTVGPGITGVSTGGGGGTGTVTSVSVVAANGFAGTVANANTTPAITVQTSINGITKGNGTALSAATAGTDYSAGTSGLATGIVKSTTVTGALSIAVSGTDYSAGTSALGSGLVKSTTGTGALSIAAAGTDYAAVISVVSVNANGNSSNFTAELVTTGAGTITRTLPAPTASAQIIYKKIDSGAGTLVINQHAAETIDGATSLTVGQQNKSVTLISDGTNWYVV